MSKQVDLTTNPVLCQWERRRPGFESPKGEPAIRGGGLRPLPDRHMLIMLPALAVVKLVQPVQEQNPTLIAEMVLAYVVAVERRGEGKPGRFSRGVKVRPAPITPHHQSPVTPSSKSSPTFLASLTLSL